MVEHDQNYTSFVVSALFHKPRGEEGALIRGEALVLNFGRWEGHLFEGGAFLRGDANSRIYGIASYIVTAIILTQSIFKSSHILDLRKQPCCLTFSYFKIQLKT